MDVQQQTLPIRKLISGHCRLELISRMTDAGGAWVLSLFFVMPGRGVRKSIAVFVQTYPARFHAP
jgi:hypothetical protein